MVLITGKPDQKLDFSKSNSIITVPSKTKEYIMSKIISLTEGPLPHLRPTIVFVENPMTAKKGFVLSNFDIEEPVDAYSPKELVAIRNAIDNAINTFCDPSDLEGQMFLWDVDKFNLTKSESEV
jgi:hypothetical protein